MRGDGSTTTGTEAGKLNYDADDQVEADDLAEIERLRGELAACHESYISQLNIAMALKEQVRVLVDVARQKADLMEKLHRNLEEHAPPVFEILRSLERITAIQRAAPAPLAHERTP